MFRYNNKTLMNALGICTYNISAVDCRISFKVQTKLLKAHLAHLLRYQCRKRNKRKILIRQTDKTPVPFAVAMLLKIYFIHLTINWIQKNERKKERLRRRPQRHQQFKSEEREKEKTKDKICTMEKKPEPNMNTSVEKLEQQSVLSR